MPAGGSSLAGVVNPAGPDGPVVAVGPVGPCETPSPSSGVNLDLLEHSVLDYTGPVGRVGPVGPDVSFEVLELLEHSVLNHADPAGQHAAVGTLSPSDCYPAGPTGPCVAGGLVRPEFSLQVLEPLDHSVLNHADLASMLLLGRCPHLTVALLAQLARMSQGAMSAQMIIFKFWNR